MCNMVLIPMASEDGDRCHPQCAEGESKAGWRLATEARNRVLPGLQPCSFQELDHV